MLKKITKQILNKGNKLELFYLPLLLLQPATTPVSPAKALILLLGKQICFKLPA